MFDSLEFDELGLEAGTYIGERRRLVPELDLELDFLRLELDREELDEFDELLLDELELEELELEVFFFFMVLLLEVAFVAARSALRVAALALNTAFSALRASCTFLAAALSSALTAVAAFLAAAASAFAAAAAERAAFAAVAASRSATRAIAAASFTVAGAPPAAAAFAIVAAALARPARFHSEPSMCDLGGRGPPIIPCHLLWFPAMFLSSCALHTLHRCEFVSHTLPHASSLYRAGKSG